MTTREETADARKERDDAEQRLEAKLQDSAEDKLDALRKEIASLQEQRDEMGARLSKVEPLLDAYSDMLSFSRRFVSLAEGAGVLAKHVRSTPARKRAAP